MKNKYILIIIIAGGLWGCKGTKNVVNTNTQGKNAFVLSRQTSNSNLLSEKSKPGLILPRDTFSSYAELKAYQKQMSNQIREVSIREFPDTLAFKYDDGKVQGNIIDNSRCAFHEKINNVPEVLRNIFPDAEFYLEKIDSYMSKYQYPICRINNENYLIPNDANLIFRAISKKELSISDKIAFIVASYGFNGNSQIISISSSSKKIGIYISSYVVKYTYNDKNYLGYLSLKEDMLVSFNIEDDKGNLTGGILFNLEFR